MQRIQIINQTMNFELSSQSTEEKGKTILSHLQSNFIRIDSDCEYNSSEGGEEWGGETRNDTSWITAVRLAVTLGLLMVVAAVFSSRPMLRKSFTDSSTLGAMAPKLTKVTEYGEGNDDLALGFWWCGRQRRSFLSSPVLSNLFGLLKTEDG